ncbi:hypothetical protein [Nakamurella multipartita]|uniref:Uncharacterized protein n=1 Tax=Nakamurella multipartita (strain ATCC 700099 / DSM 44233 / CIP 104796 / JCM 9543 / NBRC 105858 / Y-104) TaxID=479431 RepID=C8X8G9_NAKMY|nr:hypothetical protein [Nakamurella multipartita]ACV79024.1 hypothetical protein Namu_2678 [Nakamurella multipartita DSM 44233]
MRRQQTTAAGFGPLAARSASDAVDLDLLRAISWSDYPDLPVGVVHLESWRLIRAGLVARTPNGLVVTARGHRVLDEDDF